MSPTTGFDAPDADGPDVTDVDVVAVGCGPFNLGLAALASTVDDLGLVVLDSSPALSWHPGMMIDDARLQVSFLADLVTLVAPTHPLSFLAYLADNDRMYPFYVRERFHPTRLEYQDYLRWAADRLPSVRFGHEVVSVTPADTGFTVVAVCGGLRRTWRARDLVLGVGTVPEIADTLAGLPADRVVHTSGYLPRRERVLRADKVTVVGSGQSGAEVFLDLLRRRGPDGPDLAWLTRTESFAPLDYTKLVLEMTTPDYVRYFHGLPENARYNLVAAQWRHYKGISTDTLEEIHDALYQSGLTGGRPVELRVATAVTDAFVENTPTAGADTIADPRPDHGRSPTPVGPMPGERAVPGAPEVLDLGGSVITGVSVAPARPGADQACSVGLDLTGPLTTGTPPDAPTVYPPDYFGLAETFRIENRGDPDHDTPAAMRLCSQAPVSAFSLEPDGDEPDAGAVSPAATPHPGVTAGSGAVPTPSPGPRDAPDPGPGAALPADDTHGGGRVSLRCLHRDTGETSWHTTDLVIAATGYRRDLPAFLAPVQDLIHTDSRGNPLVRLDHSLELDKSVTGRIFVANADVHSHGVAAPDLGIGAWRNATIINTITGREVYRIPRHTAYTSFSGEKSE